MDWVAIIQLGILFVAIVSVIITIEKQTEVSQLTFFAEYTKRYQRIIFHLPENLDDIDILDDETKRYLRIYFDLCSEQYFLWTKGHIDEEVWEEWKEGMKSTFNKKIISKYWQERKETSYSKFNAFVEDEIIEKNLYLDILGKTSNYVNICIENTKNRHKNAEGVRH